MVKMGAGKEKSRRIAGRHLMIYDGDCGFCAYWAHRWAEKLAPHLEIDSLQETSLRGRELSTRELEEQVHLVEPGGEVYRGAEAVFRALALRRRYALGLWLYQYFPGFRRLSEWVYMWVARNRQRVSRWTRWMRRDR